MMSAIMLRRHLLPRLGLCLLCVAVTACDDKSEASAADGKKADAASKKDPGAKPDDPASATVEPEAAKPVKVAPPRPTPDQVKAKLAVPDANLTMADASANGQRMAQLNCAAGKMPLMGSIALIGAIAEHKTALDACAPKGDAALITWKSANKKMTDLVVVGAASPEVDACLAKAMADTKAPFGATCAAILLVGPDEGADAAAKALQGA